MTRPPSRVVSVVSPVRLVLPCTFARPPLMENHHRVWQEKARLVKTIRDEAHLRARGIMPEARRNGWTLPIDYPINVVLVWSVTIRRNRDANGASPTLKAWLDGMTVGTTAHPGAGLILDDIHQIVPNPRCIIEEHAERAGCRVEITSVS